MTEISKILIGIVVFSALITGMSAVFFDMSQRYSVSLYYTPMSGDSSQQILFDNTTFNQISEVNERVEELQQKIGASAEGSFNPLTIFDVLNFLFFSVSAIFLQVPNMINDVALQGEGALGILIPGWMITILVVVPIILVVAAIISWVTKRDV